MSSGDRGVGRWCRVLQREGLFPGGGGAGMCARAPDPSWGRGTAPGSTCGPFVSRVIGHPGDTGPPCSSEAAGRGLGSQSPFSSGSVLGHLPAGQTGSLRGPPASAAFAESFPERSMGLMSCTTTHRLGHLGIFPCTCLSSARPRWFPYHLECPGGVASFARTTSSNPRHNPSVLPILQVRVPRLTWENEPEICGRAACRRDSD